MVKVNLNTKKIERAAIEAFRDVAFAQGRVFTEVISEPGAFDDFPNQDIVDSGDLRRSQRLRFPSDTVATFVWENLEYGIYVHEGYTRTNGTVVKGRPWTKLGLERFDFQLRLAKLLALKLK